MAVMGRSTAKTKKPAAAAQEGEVLAEAIAYAVGCQGEGRWREAETLYGRILKVRPRHFDALHLLGVLREQQGRSAEALGLIASALGRAFGALRRSVAARPRRMLGRPAACP